MVAKIELFKEIVAIYERHGWSLQRALLRPQTSQAIESSVRAIFPGVDLHESDFDALWFARPSHAKREAWELRLLAQQPYALFEAFEADEPLADREEAKHEMENRMREYTAGSLPQD